MDQSPRPASARPGVVTTVAVLMFIGGAFSILGGLLAIAGGGYLASYDATGTLIVFGVIAIAIGAVQIWAGSGILKLREQARLVGIVIAGVSALMTIITIASGASGGILGLAIEGS